VKSQRMKEVQEELLIYDEPILISMLDGDSTEDQCAAESLTSEQYQEKLLIVIRKINKILPPVLIPVVHEDQKSNHDLPNIFEKKRQYKLPKTELKKFSGNVMEWLNWWSQFSKIHEDKDLHDSDKFQYLAQAMQEGSKAAELIKVYPQSPASYPRAVAALKDRFGKEKILKRGYVRELLKKIVSNSKEKVPISKSFDKQVCLARKSNLWKGCEERRTLMNRVRFFISICETGSRK